ncbi:MAG: TrkA family potassium uptake protein [Candidatus Thermoplasmatota archaeon]|nr:TrkA family potassium uptake protein [archaeon]MBU2565035.1 TrkA family potassium uptake protein [Candidatus Thermoplasmatota archaeon]MBU3901937.1 TrkA family potassium uptake protein [Candidatus Thermoplasmatota archaeon]
MIIICGFGTVGKKAAEFLILSGRENLAIDVNEKMFENYTGKYIIGDAKEEDVLKKADVEKASTLIACTDSDATNAFIILSALEINPDLTILARAEKIESVEKLYKAGADYVVPRTTIAGQMIAKHAVSPYAAEFISRVSLAKDVEITELLLPSGSKIANKKIGDSGIRNKSGTNIVAIKRNNKILQNLNSDTMLKENDILIVIGSAQQIKTLSGMIK